MTGRAHVLDVVPGLRALASRQAGVVRREQLTRLGVSHDHVRTQVSARRWTVIGPRLVVLQTGRLTRVQELEAAVLHAAVVRPDDGTTELAGLTARTALERLGLRSSRGSRSSPAPTMRVAVPRGTRPPRLAGLVVHQSSRWPVFAFADLTPTCLTAAWAVVEAAALEATDRSAAGLALAVVQQRLTTVDAVLDALDRAGRVRHGTAVRRALNRAAGADSLSEIDVARIMRRAGLLDVRLHVQVETRSGPRPVDIVARLPDGRLLAVEVDGLHHQDADQQRADVARDAELVALGYVVLHVPVAALSDPVGLLRRFRMLARPLAG